MKAAFLLALFSLFTPQFTSALTIQRDFIGGEPGKSDVGTGNLADIFNAAADIWEQAIMDDHVLTLHFGWAPVGGGQHTLNFQGGVPNRESEGTIFFNNDNDPGHQHFYLDPTPRENEEYSNFSETTQDLGGGIVNVARLFTEPHGDAASFEHVDLLVVALHEIGHALGISSDNTSFQNESADLEIDVTAPRLFSGTSLPLQTNLFGVTSHLDSPAYGTLMSGNNARERRLPSAIDILANGQLSQFNRLNLDLAPVLKGTIAGTNFTLSWWEIVPGFRLEQSADLGLVANWTPVEQVAGLTNALHTLTVPAAGQRRFFRLRKP